MCAAMRRNKHRRSRTDYFLNPANYTAPLFFDRLEYLQQQLIGGQKPKKPDAILVSADSFLSSAITGSLFHHLNIPVYPSLDDVIAHQTLSPVPRLIIDLDSLEIPILDVLKAIRQQIITTPQHHITLLNTLRKPEITRFMQQAVDCQIVERRLPPDKLKQALICSEPDLATLYDTPGFSIREWAILLALSRGESLKSIALLLEKPYHYVVYRFNVLLTRLGLDNRSKLLHLLHEISVANNAHWRSN
ncbi:DNA-binding response regulator [Cedecea neteri]|uniref:helix-turn-helix transcriptional regulator n=1 Tax=Cedecea neteri TaxID=158822 RepID=UPI0028A0D98A|nr:DNA-binding response regulator [Cedecea neteri]